MDAGALRCTVPPKPKGKDKLKVSKGCTPAVNFSTSARGFRLRGMKSTKRDKELCRSSFVGLQPLATHKCATLQAAIRRPWSSSCTSAGAAPRPRQEVVGIHVLQRAENHMCEVPAHLSLSPPQVESIQLMTRAKWTERDITFT